jgi:DNA polymerase III alpha subunit
MKTDIFGQQIYNESEICELYMSDPDRKITNILVDKPITISDIIDSDNLPNFILYQQPSSSIEDFDYSAQNKWFMPDQYQNFDIAQYVLDLCKTDEELQRVGQELLMFQARNMFPLLRYLKYLVDTMRENNIVWGVGRGSSVASFVLFLIGVHKINSIFYDLAIDEFLK